MPALRWIICLGGRGGRGGRRGTLVLGVVDRYFWFVNKAGLPNFRVELCQFQLAVWEET